MSSDVPSPTRGLVVVLEDPWRHRRSQQFASTMLSIGWEVTVAALATTSLPGLLTVHVVNIGHSSKRSAFPALLGFIQRNLRHVARLAVTVVTLLPHAVGFSLLEWILRQSLGLGAVARTMQQQCFAAAVVTDPLCLPTVLRFRGHARVMFDAREFFAQQYEDSLLWRWLVGGGMSRLMRRLLPLCDEVTTVSAGLAAGYRETCGVAPHVVFNVPPRGSGHRPKDSAKSICDGGLRLAYHGGANKNRALETYIEGARLLAEHVSLDLYLVGRPRHLRRHQKAVSGLWNARILPAVPFSEIPNMLADYDVGLAAYPTSTYNLRHAMPSKFFEYLHAGLAVVVHRSSEMASLVAEYDCGVVVEGPTPLALSSALDGLTPDRLARMKENAIRAAKELSAEKEYARVAELLQQMAIASVP